MSGRAACERDSPQADSAVSEPFAWREELFIAEDEGVARRRLAQRLQVAVKDELVHPREPLMIGYVTLGTNDLPRAKAFYDALLAPLGITQIMDFGRGYAWGSAMDRPALAVMIPFDQKPATPGNGWMAAIVVDSRDKVDAGYARALALGGTDEGPPGLRGGNFYAAYFRDLDGNKLNFFCLG